YLVAALLVERSDVIVPERLGQPAFMLPLAGAEQIVVDLGEPPAAQAKIFSGKLCGGCPFHGRPPLVRRRNRQAARLFRATKKAGAKTHRPSSSSPVHPCQYIRGQKHQAMAAIASGRNVPALIS